MVPHRLWLIGTPASITRTLFTPRRSYLASPPPLASSSAPPLLLLPSSSLRVRASNDDERGVVESEKGDDAPRGLRERLSQTSGPSRCPTGGAPASTRPEAAEGRPSHVRVSVWRIDTEPLVVRMRPGALAAAAQPSLGLLCLVVLLRGAGAAAPSEGGESDGMREEGGGRGRGNAIGRLSACPNKWGISNVSLVSLCVFHQEEISRVPRGASLITYTVMRLLIPHGCILTDTGGPTATRRVRNKKKRKPPQIYM